MAWKLRECCGGTVHPEGRTARKFCRVGGSRLESPPVGEAVFADLEGHDTSASLATRKQVRNPSIGIRPGSTRHPRLGAGSGTRHRIDKTGEGSISRISTKF